MPEKLSNIMNQGLDIPFMIGMVAKMRTFVIDKPMMALISMLILGSSSTGVFIYQLGEARDTIDKMGIHIIQLSKDNNKLIMEVSYMRRDLDNLANNMDKHLDGHPIRIVR